MQRRCLELVIGRDLREQVDAHLSAVKFALFAQDPDGYRHLLFPQVKKSVPISPTEMLEDTEGDWDFSQVDQDEARRVLAGLTESVPFEMPISNDLTTNLIDAEDEGWL